MVDCPRCPQVPPTSSFYHNNAASKSTLDCDILRPTSCERRVFIPQGAREAGRAPRAARGDSEPGRECRISIEARGKLLPTPSGASPPRNHVDREAHSPYPTPNGGYIRTADLPMLPILFYTLSCLLQPGYLSPPLPPFSHTHPSNSSSLTLTPRSYSSAQPCSRPARPEQLSSHTTPPRNTLLHIKPTPTITNPAPRPDHEPTLTTTFPETRHRRDPSRLPATPTTHRQRGPETTRPAGGRTGEWRESGGDR
jgi:hypothetical protein